MKHKILKIIAVILVLCISISALPNITAEQSLEEQVKANIQNELTTGEAVALNPNTELAYVYWNPNEEESTTTDGYTTIAAGNDENDGTSVSNPVLTLEKAIALAGECATIYCMNPYIISGEDLVVDGKGKTLDIVREKAHAGNIFLVGGDGTLTLRNITLAGGGSDTPIITVTEGGQVNIDEAVQFRDETTYAMLEVGAKPINFTAMLPEERVYFVALEKVEEGTPIAQTSYSALEIQSCIKLKNILETENGSFETYIEDGIMTLRKKTVIDTVYLASNGDDTYAGISPETAVRSFKRAQELKAQMAGVTSITVCDTLLIEESETWSDETIKRSTGFTGPLLDIKGSMRLENINIVDASTQQSILNEGKLSINDTSCIGGGIKSQGEMLVGGKAQLKGTVSLINEAYPLILTSEPTKSIKLNVMNFDIGDIVVKGDMLSEEALALFEVTSNNILYTLYYNEASRSYILGDSGVVFVNGADGDNGNTGLTSAKAVRNLETALQICYANDLNTICIIGSGAKIESNCNIPEKMIIKRDANYKGELFTIDGNYNVTVAQDVLLEGGIIINAGSLLLEGGTITNTLGAGIDLKQGSVNMYGGTITKCKNQAIKVSATGEFNVYGGTIADNGSETSEDVYLQGKMKILGTSSITDIIYIGNKNYPLELGQTSFEWPEKPYQISCGSGFANDSSRPVVKGNEVMKATLANFKGGATLVANLSLVDNQSPNNINIIRDEDVEAIYLNGDKADSKLGVGVGDDANDGLSIATPVKTITKAKELVEQYKKEEDLALDIIVCGQITVESQDEEWELPEYTRLLRYYAYSGAMIKVNGTTLTLKNITIDGNKEENSINSQAAVMLTAQGTLNMQEGACIKNNKNTNGLGGGINLNNATLNMTGNACITGNIAKQGGGVYGTKSTVNMSDTAPISINEVSEHGGGIYQNESELLMAEESSVRENTAAKMAGGIRQVNKSQAELTGSASVSYNIAESDVGGGIHQYGADNKVILRDQTSISYNEAREQNAGGICVASGSYLEMYDESSISYNVAKRSQNVSYGGGIYSSGDIMMTDKASVHDNSTGYGGGIWLNSSSTSKLQGEVEIYNNVATKTAGGIGQSNNTKLALGESVVIRDNQAERGGGLYLSPDKDGLFAICNIYGNVVIKNNCAAAAGGGIWQAGGQLLLYDNVSISGNITQSSGGGIATQNGKLIINNQVSISGNEATSSGGGIYFQSSEMEMLGGQINGNKVEKGYGGGIYVYPSTVTYPLLIEGNISGNTDKLGSQVTVGAGSSLGIGKGALIVQGSIYLDQDATIKIVRSIIYPKALYEVQCANEEGERIVVQPDGSVLDAAQYLSNFSLITDKCMVLSKKDQNIVIDQVYFIDGEKGRDTNTGTTPKDAFATMEKVLSIIGNSSATIYVSGPINIKKDTKWDFPEKVQIYRYTGQSILGNTYDNFYGDLIKVENNSTLTIINGHLYGKRSEAEEINPSGSILNIAEGTVRLLENTILANNETENGVITQNGQLQLDGNVQIEGTIKLGEEKYIQVQNGAQIKEGIILDVTAPETKPVLVKYEDARKVNVDDFMLSEALNAQWILMKEEETITVVEKGKVYLDPKEGKADNSGLTVSYPVQTLEAAMQVAQKTGATSICILNPVTISEDISLEAYHYVQQGDWHEPLFTISGNASSQGTLRLKAGCKLQSADKSVAVCVTAGDLIIEDADVQIEGAINLKKDKYITRTNLNKEVLLNYQIQMENPKLGDIVVKYTCTENADNEAVESYLLEDEVVSHFRLEMKEQTLRLSNLEAVYVDTKEGSDEPSRNAGTREKPLKSLEQAYKYLQEAGGKIYVMQPIEIASSVRLTDTSYSEGEDISTLIKNNGQVEIIGLCTDYLFKVTERGALTLETITIESNLEEALQGQLVNIASGGEFITHKGTVLKYNLNAAGIPAIKNAGTMTCYGGTLINVNEKNEGMQVAISQEGILNLAPTDEKVDLGNDKIKLAKNHFIQMQKPWQGTMISLDVEAAAIGDKVITFTDAAMPKGESAWDQVKCFSLSDDNKTLVQDGQNTHVLIIAEALSVVEAPKDYLGQIGEQVEFVVKCNASIHVEKTKISISDNKDTKVENFSLNTEENSIVIPVTISEETIGTYTVTMQYMSGIEVSSFVLSAYEVAYGTEENKLIARASLTETPHEETAKLKIYSGYNTVSMLTVSHKSLKAVTEGFEPELVADIKAALEEQDCFAVAVPIETYVDGTGVLEIKLSNSNLLSDKMQGEIILEGLTLRQSDTNSSQSDIKIPFETKAVTGAVIRIEKNNVLEEEVSLKAEQGGQVYKLTADEHLRISYIEDIPAGKYSIWRGEMPTGKVIEVKEGQLSKLTLRYYTLILMHNDGTGASTEKEVLNGTYYGDVLEALSREGFYFEGYYTKAEGGEKYESEQIVNLEEPERLYARWTKKNYALEVSEESQDSPLVYGYAEKMPMRFIIRNTGNVLITQLQVSLDVGTNFELEHLEKQQLAPGELAEVIVRPKLGLAAGIYSAQLEITSKETQAECRVIQEIQKAVPEVILTAPSDEMTYVYQGEKLPNLKGTAVYKGNEVAGTLTWEKPEAIIEQSGEYIWKFIPEVYQNYETVSGKVLIQVKGNKPSDGGNSSGSSSSGGNIEKEEIIRREENYSAPINEGEVPYYIQDGERVVIGFSMALDNTLKYMAPPNQEVYTMNNPKYFKDIEGHWAKSAIDFITAREVFVGVTNEIFKPNGDMTRGMIVTVLGRLYERSYEPITLSSLRSFDDVSETAYYAKYIAWAKENDLIEGRTSKIFDPNASITREEFAKMLYKFSRKLGEDIRANEDALGIMEDQDDISDWAVESVAYCIEASLMKGSGNQLRPRDFVTRAECAQVLERYIKMIVSHNC